MEILTHREPPSVGEAGVWAGTVLEEAGIMGAKREARDLVAAVLGVKRTEFVLMARTRMEGYEWRRVLRAVGRRALREPFAYVVGSSSFMDMELEVAPGVLVPRPETEIVVELALEEAAGIEDGVAADIGTGCGAIALSLARMGRMRVLATDISREALAVARRNVEKYGAGDRVTLVEGPLWEPLERMGMQGRLAMVVSNPPYVAREEWDELPREVAGFEPRVALDGGEGGMGCYPELLGRAAEFLVAGGPVLLEVGAGRGSAVSSLARDAGLAEVRIVADRAGRDRVLVARAPS